MRGVRDVRCPECGYLDEDVTCDNEAMPPCPECETTLVTSWHTGVCPSLETYMVFKPLTIGGCTINSKAEHAAFMAKAQRRLGPHVGEVEMVSDSPAQRRQDCDELEHERITKLKSAGYTPSDVTARKAEIKAHKEESHVHAS